jgi:hypothetical protein
MSIRHGKLEHPLHAHLFPTSEPVRLRSHSWMLVWRRTAAKTLPDRVRSPVLSAKLHEGFALSGGGENVIRRAFRLNGDRIRWQSYRGAVLQRVRGKQYLRTAATSRIVDEVVQGGFLRHSGESCGEGQKGDGNRHFECYICLTSLPDISLAL